MATAGITAAASSAIAMGWNYFYNILFESWEARQPRKARSVLRRIVTPSASEAGLVAILVPLFAWVLGVDLLTALMLQRRDDRVLPGLRLFNLAFDRVFGLPLSAQGR